VGIDNLSTGTMLNLIPEAKRLGEVYCYEYYSKFGVEVKVARVFNTYSSGLRNDDGRVISNFVESL
jgi:UDP-glucuronate decarboxylase